eukprot:NODE_10022_length_1382_cov_5.620717.p1 GENE.NODE_10022_length_1382_cov_5.620717~~NODE_10022_length_1382_cov_5.620717.p1  ORF type:complete len:375 (+),score=91.04 NODE_10022_length_1382_cov_5.620717:38-1162(+)
MDEIAASPCNDRGMGSAYSTGVSGRDVATAPVLPLMLRACGIITWAEVPVKRWWCSPSVWYQWLVAFMLLVAVASCCKELDPELVHPGVVSHAVQALGSLLTFSPVLVPAYSRCVRSYCQIILVYGHRTGFLEQWMAHMWRDRVIGVVIWLCAVIERILTLFVFHPGGSTWDVVHMMLSVSSMAVLVALTYSLLYFCHALLDMLDSFAKRAVRQKHLSKIVADWDIMHAVLHQASHSLKHHFFGLMLASFGIFLALVLEVAVFLKGAPLSQHSILVPTVLILMFAFRPLFLAASVTDSCLHIPSLVNQLALHPATDVEHRNVVHYIVHSNAGFYIYDVPVTTDRVSKVAYISGLLLFTRLADVLNATPLGEAAG